VAGNLTESSAVAWKVELASDRHEHSTEISNQGGECKAGFLLGVHSKL
jgi:hypothetical protein